MAQITIDTNQKEWSMILMLLGLGLSDFRDSFPQDFYKALAAINWLNKDNPLFSKYEIIENELNN